MAKITAVTREGQEIHLEAKPGNTLLDTLRNGGIHEILALCGGCCSCATCHVYVPEDYLAKLPAMSPDENDLLDGSMHRTAASRLSCQVVINEALDGMRVTVAPED